MWYLCHTMDEDATFELAAPAPMTARAQRRLAFQTFQLAARAREGPIEPAEQHQLATDLERGAGGVASRAFMYWCERQWPRRASARKPRPVDPEQLPILDTGAFAARLLEVAARGCERPPSFTVDRRPGTRRPMRTDALAACAWNII
jgi:hypothetical protein